MEVQNYLFETLDNRYADRSILIAELSELLGVQADGIYRRMRGDTLITANELGKVCKHFGISLDAMIQNDPSQVFFEFSAFKTPIQSVEQYIDELTAQFEQVSRIKDGKIYYATSEVPVFYYAFFPELLLFKLYVWGKTIWDIDAYKNTPYDPDIIPYHVRQKALDLVKGYIQLDTVELWSFNIADNTLNQIYYHADIGGFKDMRQSLMLCDKMVSLIGHFESMVEKGRKYMPEVDQPLGEMVVYHNEMIYTNNTIYFHSPSDRMLFTTLANPNFLRTQSPELCDYKEKWFDELISKSIPMTDGGEKHRSKFFTSLRKGIERTRNKLQILIDE